MLMSTPEVTALAQTLQPTLPLFNNSLLAWLIALAVIALLMPTLLLIRSAIRRYHARLLQTERTELAEIPLEILSRTSALFLFVVATFLGLGTLEMSATTARIFRIVFTVTMFWQVGIWASAAAMASAMRGTLSAKGL